VSRADHTENITQYIRGLARQPGALRALEMSLMSLGNDQWQQMAEQRLLMRQTSLLDVMSNTELQAVANGTVSLWKITRAMLEEPTSQASVQAVQAVEEAQTPAEILDTLEVIALRKLGRTLKASGNDRCEFFEVNVATVQAAMLSAFLAGMQFKD
jgi:hypothetical protein